MPTSQPFAQFASRLTRGYVVLAVALIAVVTGTSLALAFIAYAATYNQAMDSEVARVQQHYAEYSLHHTFSQIAQLLITDESHSRAHLVAYDEKHVIVGGADVPQTMLTQTISALLNLHNRHLYYATGSIVLQPDIAGFIALMERYLLLIFPVGLLAVIVAWIAGRGISRRAVRPLEDVSSSLRAIAAGDFEPKLILESDSGLHELTHAYNGVAQRLNVATLEQRRQEGEMRQFIADAGHELRTPLTIFMGYLDALRSGVVSDPSAVTRVQETMLDETRKMRSIIEKLILLARMEREHEPARDVIELQSIAARAVDALRPIAGERLEFVQDGASTVTGDDTELYEAVKNVVENAVRYAPQSPVRVVVGRTGDEGTIQIADRGPGMQPLDIEHAFDRFYRGMSHGDVDGSGLGLAIAKRAVERMGGSIALDSRIGEGTTVTMRFPVN